MWINRTILFIFICSIKYLAICQQGEGIELFSESEITLPIRSGLLYGTLAMPLHHPDPPVVLMIAGSGPTDRNGNNPQMTNNSLKMVAQSLAETGIASLRYDKRGIAQSAAAMTAESDLRFDHLVEDATDWIALLRKDRRFSKVIVAGHSEGSLIGMLAAQNGNADAFISIAGIASNASRVLKDQIAAGSPLFSEVCNVIIDSLVSGYEVQNVPPLLNSLFRKSVQPYLISWFKYTPAAEIQKLKIPIMIIQGTHDIQVSVEEGNALHKAAPKSKYLEVKGMNHVLKAAPEERFANIAVYSQPDAPLHPELMYEIIRFIQSL
jgi:fermentation-respiration switch protein FrsA (DUF1100 family)